MARDHNAIRRAERMRVAREKGRHTPAEWAALVTEFGGRCVRCGSDQLQVERDHIIPVYKGGSDGLDNLQPLCARCNAAKGPEEFNWVEFRRRHGWEA